MLLESSPNWIDAETVNVHYLNVQQIFLATFFSPKEGPHRLEARKDPISIGNFLLDFPGGATTKIYVIVKYWLDKDKANDLRKQKDVSEAFISNIKREAGVEKSNRTVPIKKEHNTFTMLSVGQEVYFLLCFH